jgi:hypothetical protein
VIFYSFLGSILRSSAAMVIQKGIFENVDAKQKIHQNPTSSVLEMVNF